MKIVKHMCLSDVQLWTTSEPKAQDLMFQCTVYLVIISLLQIFLSLSLPSNSL